MNKVSNLKKFKTIRKKLEETVIPLPLGIESMKAFDDALKEELKNYTIVEKPSPIEEAKRREEEKWTKEQSGQKKFRKNGNNRKRTKGRNK